MNLFDSLALSGGGNGAHLSPGREGLAARAIPGADRQISLHDRLHQTEGYARLTPEGIALLKRLLISDPARTVGVGALTSVSGELRSECLGQTAQFESLSGERFFLLLSELDSESIFVLDQPAPLRVRAHDRRGRRAWRHITPDFLDCRRQLFCFVEVKPLAKVQKRASDYPQDWINEGERWRYLPGEVAARQMGFDYIVFIQDTYSQAFQTNSLFRWQVWRQSSQALPAMTLAKVQAALVRGPQSVAQLCESIPALTGGGLLTAIEHGQLFGLLEKQIFEDDFLIFGTQAEQSRHRGWLEGTKLDEPPGPLLTRLLRATIQEVSAAQKKLIRYESDRATSAPLNSTGYRFKKLLSLVKAEGAPKIAAFLPDFQGRGGAGRPINDTLRQSIIDACKEYSREGKGKRHPGGAREDWEKVYPDLADQVSEETFRKIYHATLSPERIALESRGSRGFHHARPRTDGRLMNARAAIPGLCVHLDGVYADALSVNDEAFDRPVYFPLVDDVSGYVLGRGVQTNRPSSLAMHMALADCIQRHGWFPAVLMRDLGSENTSHQAPELLSLLGGVFQHRPRAASRSGGMGESFNAAFNAYAAEIDGGMYFDAAGRAADGSKKARKHAIHALTTLIRLLDQWIFEVWNLQKPNDGDLTRQELFKLSRKRYPEAMIRFSDGPQLRYHTGYPTRIKEMDYQRGIRHAGSSFASVELASAIRQRCSLSDPRLDCLDPSVLWLSDGKRYIAAYSQHYTRVQGMDFAQRVGLYHEMALFGRRCKQNARDRRKHKREMTTPVIAATNTAPTSKLQLEDVAWPTSRVPLSRLGEE